MKAFKKIAVFFLCIIITLTMLSGCNLKESVKQTISDLNINGEENPGIDKIAYTLPYVRTDSLNPYKSQTVTNSKLALLLYDSLFTVNNDFTASPVIAESYSHDGNKMNVIIKTGLTFIDGTAITAQDVVYSYEAAKDSDSFDTYLSNISSAEAQGNNKISFTLKVTDKNEACNLIFPIIKTNSDVSENSSDDYTAHIPTGSGRYFLEETTNGRQLTVNKTRLGGYNPKYNFIGLKDITDEKSLGSLFNLEEIDSYTEDFVSGKYTRITGNATETLMTNFVFLGINSNKKVFSDNKVRIAIALLLNRKDLTSVSFAGFGEAVSTPFPNTYTSLNGCTLPTIKTDKDSAVTLLEEAGFDRVSELGIRYADNSKLELNLLVNAENSFKLAMARSIQQSLAKADIIVNIKEYSYKKYINAVENGSYDLYIGEAKLSNSISLKPFFTENGSLNYGISKECASAIAYSNLLNEKISMQEFIDTFSDDLPFIPIAYRHSVTVTSDNIATQAKTSIIDSYSNIDEWTVN